MRRCEAGLAGGLVCVIGVLAPLAGAQTPLTLQRVAAGLTRPCFVAAPPGDTARLFIVEQRTGSTQPTTGRIRILNLATGIVQPTSAPFLSVGGLSAGSEQGLLGLAFHPRFNTPGDPNNGVFFVHYTTSPSPGNVTVARYRVSTSNPDLADPASADVILQYSRPASNHNAGWIAFGPEGYLYVASGDSGGGNDPGNDALDPSDLRGKILRIDVNSDQFPADANRDYAIPPNNPFAAGVGGAPEVWALGLRNPYRCSFDRLTGDLYIGDVGQDTREEISWQPAGDPLAAVGAPGYQGNRNYGWRCREGTVCNPAVSCSPCTNPAWIDPIYDYAHLTGPCGTGSGSVTGGYVYRGCAIPDLRGTYFFADYCTRRLFSLVNSAGVAGPVTDRTAELTAALPANTVANVASFGEDGRGELYVVRLADASFSANSGEVYRITAAAPYNFDCDGDGLPDPCEAVVCPGDLDCNGSVGANDLSVMLGAFGLSLGQPGFNARADIDRNRVVGANDLSTLLVNFGANCGP
ncbi:MAG: PQQ-dependent sugar dehydrogenase [Phycisphaerales bacterium]|nr:PQQ-dependent sugar dehydrogenase [Phycisphaerales bacterium]